MELPSESQCAVLCGIKEIKVENRTVPPPGQNEVLLAVNSVGICGSDLKYWSHGYCGRFKMTGPMVIGHEASGTVAAVGSGVKHLAVGDRVAIEPGVPCRMCSLCREGKYNLCKDVQFCATPPVDGNLCQYYLHPADFCFKLPSNVSFDEGALVEPLAVALYTCSRANVTLGSKVLICGSGPVGILTMLTAKSMGASQVIITDIDDHRLEVAKQYGADFTLNVMGLSSKDAAEKVVDLLGSQPHCGMECCGSDIALITCIMACRPGGSVLLVGRGSMEPKLPVTLISVKELELKGIFRYANMYPKAISLLSSGQMPVKGLVTHRFPLQRVSDAFETAASRECQAMKVIIHCD
ncbi:sorbitol dehydrogenase-like [Diadema antillarum]|uniref:sorbitol dehydrogenase-like n=1 Tax=Diadema antillarum TaxID=105358 RepID=UPI003A85FCA0